MSQRAIFFVDPGGSTGVAWGIFDDRAETVVESMRSREMSGSATIHHGRVEGGDSRDFQDLICNHVNDVEGLWRKFYKETYNHCDMIEFGVEHFVLTTGPNIRHKPGVEGIFPAFLVGAILASFDDQIFLQTASAGMKWHKRKFHDSYQTWVVGKEHEREAWAHVAARLHKVLR